MLTRALREAFIQATEGSREGEIVAICFESDPLNSIAIMLPPIPIRILVGLVALVPILVVAVRFIFPLGVMAVLTRSPFPMLITSCAEERNYQCRRKQKTTNFFHANPFDSF